mgnify:CR=1 FL=1
MIRLFKIENRPIGQSKKVNEPSERCPQAQPFFSCPIYNADQAVFHPVHKAYPYG